MGNYYELVNFDKKERIGALDHWGIKWGSFTLGAPQMAVLSHLICNGSPISGKGRDLEGRWFGDRIGLVGDFSEISEETDEYTDVTPLIVEAFSETPYGLQLLMLPAPECKLVTCDRCGVVKQVPVSATPPQPDPSAPDAGAPTHEPKPTS
jgi:hypothetical protein